MRGGVLDALKELCASGDFDGACRVLARAFEDLPCASPLVVEPMGRYNYRGRPVCIVRLSRDGWRTENTPHRLGFHLHIEPQYELLTCWLRVYLHYELNPYRTQKQAESLPSDQLAEYKRDRIRFFEHVKRELPAHLTLRSRPFWNQIGRFDFAPKLDLPQDEFRRAFCATIAPTVDVIDRYLGCFE